MIRLTVVLIATLGVAACGSSRSSGPSYSAPTLYATGPIQQACQRAGRKASSRARCGCIQAVANRELSARDQRRGAGYFSNQHALQEVRQSDNPGNERFWKAWKAYGQRAASVCKGT